MNAHGIDTDAATIEPMLETMIREHGIDTVLETLDSLLDGRAWLDWQRVHNTAKNIARRLQRGKNLHDT